MNREQKKKVIENFKKIFEDNEVVMLLKNNGISASESKELRRLIKSASGKYVVTKNRLAKIAIKDTDFANLNELFLGPVAIAYSNDPVSISKILVKFCEDNKKLELVGGAMKRDGVFHAKDIEAYAKLPSLEELRAKIIGLISSPATKLVKVLNEPASQVARILKTYSNKK